jgi:predicted nucleic acid-binding protein
MARVVLDANIVLSALIKDAYTREFITKSGHEFWFPEGGVDRIEKYKGGIMEKSGLAHNEIDSLFESLFKQIQMIPEKISNTKLLKAKDIMGDIDKEDALFVACALSLQDSVIWSNDKHLKKQNLVRVYTTKEIMKMRNDKKD